MDASRFVRRAGALLPGLRSLWHSGAWWGLGLALGFLWSLSAAIVATFVWPEWLSPSTVWGCWLAAATFEGVGIWLSVTRGDWSAVEQVEPPLADLFPAALAEYLKGNWYQAESLGRQMLARDGRDAEAHLLLASTFRRSGRFVEARRRLDLLATFETAAAWEWEMSVERTRIDEAEGIDRDEKAANLTFGKDSPPPERPDLRRAA